MSAGSVKAIADKLKLQPHPEGGYYAETYRGEIMFNGRNCCTGIYYMLTKKDKSKFHRLTGCDELWHFYSGGPITIVSLHKDYGIKKFVLGNNFRKGQLPQYVVKAGEWFGAYPNQGTEYALVGCTVSPGFDFKNFEMADKETLLREFPSAGSVIERLVK